MKIPLLLNNVGKKSVNDAGPREGKARVACKILSGQIICIVFVSLNHSCSTHIYCFYLYPNEIIDILN